jgi:hypothetical protein
MYRECRVGDDALTDVAVELWCACTLVVYRMAEAEVRCLRGVCGGEKWLVSVIGGSRSRKKALCWRGGELSRGLRAA